MYTARVMVDLEEFANFFTNNYFNLKVKKFPTPRQIELVVKISLLEGAPICGEISDLIDQPNGELVALILRTFDSWRTKKYSSITNTKYNIARIAKVSDLVLIYAEFQDKKEDISMEELNSQTGISALQFMNLTANDDGDEYLLRPRVLCADGFSISIQGGNRFSYCQPRALCRIFESVELGFPNRAEDSIIQYIDGPEGNPLGSVYGFVPIEVVDEMVAKHGGIVDIDIAVITGLKTSHSAYYEKCREAVHRELLKLKETGRYD